MSKAETTTTRRAALGAIAVGAAAIPSLAAAGAVAPDPVFAAIETHRAAYAVFNEAVRAGSRLVSIPEQIDARIDEASAGETAAAEALAATVPTTFGGVAAVLKYVADFGAGRS